MTLAVVLSVMWLVVLWRLPGLWSTPQRRIGTIVLLAVTASATTLHLDIRPVVDRFVGVPDLTILLGHVLALVTIMATLELGALVIDADRARRSPLRRSQIALTVAMVCLCVLFPVLPRRFEQPDFGTSRGDDIKVFAYLTIFQVCLAIGMATGRSFLGTHWRSAQPGPLRTALKLLWLGSTLILGYVLGRSWAILTQGFGLDTPVDDVIRVTARYLLQGALLLAGVSGLIPLVHRLRRLARRQADYRRLRGLWTTLTLAAPATVLRPPPHPLVTLLSIRSTELLLYRRAVEIRDAQVELAGRVPAKLRDAIKTALPEGDELSLDACVLLIALELDHAQATTSDSDVLSWSSAVDLDGEVASLVALASRIRDPVVTGVAAQVGSSV